MLGVNVDSKIMMMESVFVLQALKLSVTLMCAVANSTALVTIGLILNFK